MNFPVQIDLFGQKIYLHFIMECLAFFIGIRYYYFIKKRQKNSVISDQNRLWILLGAMVGALLGSRIIANLETPELLGKLSLIEMYQNKTVLGGFLGGLFGVEITKYFIGEKQSSGDLYVLPIILALFIGRIGCFSMGVYEPTHGIETSFFTGMDLGDGKLRHPIMLYEMFFLLLLAIFFISIRHQKLENGLRFKIFMLAYFSFRFFMEFLKPSHPIACNLSIIQWCAIFIWLYYGYYFYKKHKL